MAYAMPSFSCEVEEADLGETMERISTNPCSGRLRVPKLIPQAMAVHLFLSKPPYSQVCDAPV